MEWTCLICEKPIDIDPGSTGSLKPACWPSVAGGTISIDFGWFSRFDDLGIDGHHIIHQAVICDGCYENKRHLTRTVVSRQITEWELDEEMAEPKYVRAGGGSVCDSCGKAYYDHPQHGEFPFLNTLCDGTVVKL